MRLPTARPPLAIQEMAVVVSDMLEAWVGGTWEAALKTDSATRVRKERADKTAPENSVHGDVQASDDAARGDASKDIGGNDSLGLLLELVVGLLRRRAGLRRNGQQNECPRFVTVRVARGLLKSVLESPGKDCDALMREVLMLNPVRWMAPGEGNVGAIEECVRWALGGVWCAEGGGAEIMCRYVLSVTSRFRWVWVWVLV